MRAPFKHILAAAAAVSLLAASSAIAQTASDQGARFEVGGFGGLQFWKLRQDKNPVPASFAPGGLFGGRFTYDFAKYVGFEAQLIPYAVNNYRYPPTPPTALTNIPFGGRNLQLVANPMFYFTPRTSRVRPFLMAGPAFEYFRPTGDAQDMAKAAANARWNAAAIDSKAQVAGVFGGGLKVGLGQHWGIRMDLRGVYSQNPHMHLPGNSTGPGSLYVPPKGSQMGFQALAGIGYRWGAKPAPAPPEAPKTKACPDGSTVPIDRECPPPPKKEMRLSLSPAQTETCAGPAIPVKLVTNVPANAGASYKWTVNGQPISQGPTFEFGTNGVNEGTYRIGVSGVAPGYNDAGAETAIRVLPYRAPSGSVSASPAEIWAGDKATLSADFTNACGGPIRVTRFTPSEGSVQGNTFDSTSVQFDPTVTAEQRKTVTITADASDQRGTGSGSGSVVVRKKANPLAKRLPDIVFANGSARVNNCGKRVLLEELKAMLSQDPGGKVVLVGHIGDREPKRTRLDRRRALNAAAIVSAGKGICLNFPANQVLVKEAGTKQEADFQPYLCGTSAVPKTRERGGQSISARDKNAQNRRVEVWFVPSGAQMPASGAGAQESTTLKVSALGCPR